jgi:hypothetical protein
VDHAVSTFAKAKELVSGTGVIYITGEVTVSDAQTWSLPGDPETGSQPIVQRYGEYIGCLVRILQPNGHLTLQDIIIDGNEAVDASSEMLHISGNLDGQKAVLTMNSGTILKNNHNKSGATGGAIRLAGYDGLFEMNGGMITGNKAANQGGAIYLNRGHFVMNGGMITANSANQGGGIYYASTPSEGQRFELNSGSLINNTAPAGSGSAIFYTPNAAATNRLTTIPVISSDMDIAGEIFFPYASNRNPIYLQLTGPLSEHTEIIFGIPSGGAVDGRPVAQGAGYTLTDEDLSKFTYYNNTMYFKRDSGANSILLTTIAPNTRRIRFRGDFAAVTSDENPDIPIQSAVAPVGGSFSFNVIPDTGYEVLEVTADTGTVAGGNGHYTLENVTQETAVTVVAGELRQPADRVIYTARDLREFAEDVNNGTYQEQIARLGADIDLGDIPWTPIGNYSYPFSGVFDGDGYGIRGLWVENADQRNVNAGLFGYGSEGTIKNLTVAGRITLDTGSSGAAGGIIAMAGTSAGAAGVDIIHCVSYVDIDSVNGETGAFGGIAGYYKPLTYGMVRCVNYGDIRVENNALIRGVGGLAGAVLLLDAPGPIASQSANYGDIRVPTNNKNDSNVGGILGTTPSSIRFNSYIDRCVNMGDINAEVYYTGGIVGLAIGTYITNCYNLGDIVNDAPGSGATSSKPATGTIAGFFVGLTYADALMENCYAAGGAGIPLSVNHSENGGIVRSLNNYADPSNLSETANKLGSAFAYRDGAIRLLWEIAPAPAYPADLNLPADWGFRIHSRIDTDESGQTVVTDYPDSGDTTEYALSAGRYGYTVTVPETTAGENLVEAGDYEGVFAIARGRRTLAPADLHAFTGMALTGLPAKLTYAAGEALDLTGLEVSLNYLDGIVSRLGPEDLAAQGVRLTLEKDPETPGSPGYQGMHLYPDANDGSALTLSYLGRSVTGEEVLSVTGEGQLPGDSGEAHEVTVLPNGDVTVETDKETAFAKDVVRVNLSNFARGKVLDSIVASDENDDPLELTVLAEGVRYAFTMPDGPVTVEIVTRDEAGGPDYGDFTIFRSNPDGITGRPIVSFIYDKTEQTYRLLETGEEAPFITDFTDPENRYKHPDYGGIVYSGRDRAYDRLAVVKKGILMADLIEYYETLTGETVNEDWGLHETTSLNGLQGTHLRPLAGALDHRAEPETERFFYPSFLYKWDQFGASAASTLFDPEDAVEVPMVLAIIGFNRRNHDDPGKTDNLNTEPGAVRNKNTLDAAVNWLLEHADDKNTLRNFYGQLPSEENWDKNDEGGANLGAGSTYNIQSVWFTPPYHEIDTTVTGGVEGGAAQLVFAGAGAGPGGLENDEIRFRVETNAVVKGVTVSGSVGTLTPVGGEYTFTMPDEPVTVTVELEGTIENYNLSAETLPEDNVSVTFRKGRLSNGIYSSSGSDITQATLNDRVYVRIGTIPSGWRYKTISAVNTFTDESVTVVAESPGSRYYFTMPAGPVHVVFEIESTAVAPGRSEVSVLADPLNSARGSAEKITYEAGEPVTVTVLSVSGGRRLTGVTARDANGVALTVAQVSGKYTFTMPPRAVTVTLHTEAAPTYDIIADSGVTHGILGFDKAQTWAGDTVIVTAEPEAGYRLAEGSLTYNGAPVSFTGGYYSFTMPSRTATVSAVFEPIPPDTYAVTVTGGTAALTAYAEGETVVISADAPADGYRFDHWASADADVVFDAAGEADTYFTMPDHAVAVEAVFAELPAETIYVLTVESAGTGASAGGSYAAGDTVSIRAGAPPVNQRFVRWTSEDADVIFGAAGAPDTQFVMPAHDVTVRAVFELGEAPVTYRYRVTVNSAGSGAYGSGSYAEGDWVSVSAGTAPAGRQFVRWTVSGVTLNDAYAARTGFTMPANAVTATAVFENISEPPTEEPGTSEPDPDEPTTEEPGTSEPDPDEPTTEEPGTSEPDPDEPTTEEPGTSEPDPDEPTTEEPGTSEPDPDEPTTEEPGASEPGSDEPTTEPPATEPPATQPGGNSGGGTTNSGSSGGGGGAGGSWTAPAAGGQVQVDYNQSGSDVTLSLPGSKVEEIIRGSAGTASIDLSKAANATTAVLPRDTLGARASANLTLELKLPHGAVSLSPQAARSVAAQAAGGQLRLEVKTVSTASLNARQQAAVGSAPVYEINLTSGSQYITAFDGGLVTVALPYTLKPGENPAGVVVWYLDEAGNIQRMNGMFDVRTQTVIFTTDHFSKYFVTYDPKAAAEAEAAAAVWVNPFGDVHAGDWFYGDVAYAHRNGLFGGTSAAAFSPNLPMNRAMLATVLGRMAKVNASVYAAAFSFGDVAAGQYYAPYVQWAHANAIMTGAGGGAFVPGGPVARQDLAVALMNYARHTGKQLPVKQAYTGFADDGAIDAYARDSVEALCRAGIIGGKPGNLFDPAGSVTRAEVAAVLRRFIEAGR